MSEKPFGVYGKLVEPLKPLLTEKECLNISKCIDKTQLAVEIYEAVGRIRRKYDDYLLDEWSNDSLDHELHLLSEAVAPYYREPGQYNRNVNDAVAAALELYRAHIVLKRNGFDVSRIINKAKMNPGDETKSDEVRYDLEHLNEYGTWVVCMENLDREEAVRVWRAYSPDQNYRLLEHKSVWRVVSMEEFKRRRE